MNQPPANILRDQAGNPIRIPRTFEGTYEQFGAHVAKLDALCCSFPDGQRLDPRTKQPCRRERICEDGCEHHAAKKASKRLRYGKSLPASTRKKFALFSVDDELLNIAHDVALYSARLQELQARLDTGESSSAWRTLHNTYTDFRTAQANIKAAMDVGDEEDAAKWMAKSNELINHIGKLIYTGNRNEETWQQILAISQQIANLKTLETRRRRESGSVMGVDEVLAVVQQLHNVIFDEIKEDGPRTRIAVKLAAMFNIATVRSAAAPTDRPLEPATPIDSTPTDSTGLSVDYYLNRNHDDA